MAAAIHVPRRSTESAMPEPAPASLPTIDQAHSHPSPLASIFDALGIKPNDDAVRMRAYQIYLERAAKGDEPNDPDDNWRRAERELRRS